MATSTATPPAYARPAPAKVFPIAPMDTTITVLTALALSLIPLMLGLALAAPLGGPWFGGAALLMSALYALVWVWWRPCRFEVTDTELRYVYPARVRVIPRSLIRGARVFDARSFRARYGWGLRVGVGGLWGGFGLLITRRGTFDMAITCLDDLVVVRCDGRRDLLLTPADVQGFVDALR